MDERLGVYDQPGLSPAYAKPYEVVWPSHLMRLYNWREYEIRQMWAKIAVVSNKLREAILTMNRNIAFKRGHQMTARSLYEARLERMVARLRESADDAVPANERRALEDDLMHDKHYTAEVDRLTATRNRLIHSVHMCDMALSKLQTAVMFNGLNAALRGVEEGVKIETIIKHIMDSAEEFTEHTDEFSALAELAHGYAIPAPKVDAGLKTDVDADIVRMLKLPVAPAAVPAAAAARTPLSV